MAVGKINIKIGTIEVSYEGDEEYIRHDLLPSIQKLKDMFGIDCIKQVKKTHEVTIPNGLNDSEDESSLFDVQTIASKLDAKTGPSLVLAAASYLTFFEDCQEFSRKQLLDTMKEAKGFYKETFGSNLSYTLKGLVKNAKLNNTGTDKYTLPNDVREELRTNID